MTRYRIPDAPLVTRVWTVKGDSESEQHVTEWRAAGGRWYPVDQTVDPAGYRWIDLLSEYDEVHDVHPVFGYLPPFPWSVSVNDAYQVRIMDSDGDVVFLVTDEQFGYDAPSLAHFIVDTVNERVEK